MVHRWAPPALGLLASLLVASTASSQGSNQRAEKNQRRGILGQNDPNPFSTETTIPFSIGDTDCAAGTQHHVVTLRIYNILSQTVAVAGITDGESTRALLNLALPCGPYVARWDGKHAPDGRDAAPGVYMYQLLIDGHPAGMKKMILKR